MVSRSPGGNHFQNQQSEKSRSHHQLMATRGTWLWRMGTLCVKDSGGMPLGGGVPFYRGGWSRCFPLLTKPPDSHLSQVQQGSSRGPERCLLLAPVPCVVHCASSAPPSSAAAPPAVCPAVVQYFLSPLLLAPGSILAVLLSNGLFLTAFTYYHYLNFLGYDGTRMHYLHLLPPSLLHPVRWHAQTPPGATFTYYHHLNFPLGAMVLRHLHPMAHHPCCLQFFSLEAFESPVVMSFPFFRTVPVNLGCNHSAPSVEVGRGPDASLILWVINLSNLGDKCCPGLIQSGTGFD